MIDVGTARVLITGDYSKLASDFSVAQGIAATGSKAIGTTVSNAFAGSSLLVDQFGRAIRSASSAVVAAGPPVLDLTGGIQRLAFAEALLAQQIEAANAAGGHQVTQLQAISGGIRTALGEQSIRAAERFIALLPGVGKALTFAFPVIGAVALGSAIARVASEATGLKAAQEDLAKQTQATDAAYEKAARSIQRVGVELQTLQFSAGAGKRLEVFYSELNASEDLQKIDTLKQKIREVAELEGNVFNHPMLLMPFFGDQAGQASVDKIKALGEQIDALQRDHAAKEAEIELQKVQAKKTADQELGAIDSARLATRLSALTHETDLSKQMVDAQVAAGHRVAQAEIEGLRDSTARAVASAAEELRVAELKESQLTEVISRETLKRIQIIRQKAAAEGAGKNEQEQSAIRIRVAGEVADAEADAASKIFSLNQEVMAAKGRLDDADAVRVRTREAEKVRMYQESFDAITRFTDETRKVFEKGTDAQIVGIARVDEIQAKGAGAIAEQGIQRQKLERERQYGLEVGHTLQQQISYMQDLASLDNQAREAKITGLKAELEIAKTIDDQVERKLKVAEIQQQINDLEAQGANATYAANTRIKETQKQGGLGNKLGNDAQAGAGQLGQALAKGVMEGGHGIGKDIKQSLAGIGKQMLGDIFQKGIEEMVIAITGNTIATNINTFWTQIQAAASFLGFASGGRPAPGVPYVVGENGPELRIDDGPGTIIPNGMFSVPRATQQQGALAGGSSVGSTISTSSSSSSATTFSFGEMHFHGVQNVRQLMSEIADVSKNLHPSHSPGNDG